MRPLLVNVADLVHRPGARRRISLAAPLSGLEVTGSAVPLGADVRIDLLLEAVSDGILASGKVSADWEAECRRCLGPVTGRAEADVRELFERGVAAGGPGGRRIDNAGPGGRRIDNAGPEGRRMYDGDSYLLRHEHIDLEPLAREEILLELPLVPLCHEGCQGLCPTCGADLNRGPCDCAEQETDPRWAALDALRSDE